MQGDDAHVFLFRRGKQRCLSVPDPGATEPGDRGVTCSPPDVFERFGVSLTIGSNYAAVIPDSQRPPIYRHADGTREPLDADRRPRRTRTHRARLRSVAERTRRQALDGRLPRRSAPADHAEQSTRMLQRRGGHRPRDHRARRGSMLLAQHRTASETQRHALRSRESRRVSIFSTTSRAAFGRRPAARGSLRSPVLAGQHRGEPDRLKRPDPIYETAQRQLRASRRAGSRGAQPAALRDRRDAIRLSQRQVTGVVRSSRARTKSQRAPVARLQAQAGRPHRAPIRC